jgi:hypothetical protein
MFPAANIRGNKPKPNRCIPCLMTGGKGMVFRVGLVCDRCSAHTHMRYMAGDDWICKDCKDKMETCKKPDGAANAKTDPSIQES